MFCKSCSHSLKENDSFCSNCGAKIINNRISLKGTWTEFVGPFFSWDNNFWRTCKGMFTNPKDVMEAYINGARKKYFHPFSFLILFTTIAVFFYKFFPFVAGEDFTQGYINGAGDNAKKMNSDFGKNYIEFIMNYFNFVMIASIPIYAAISYWVFKKQGHNFSEHIIFNCYQITIYGYIGLIIQLILMHLFELNSSLYINLNYLVFIGFSFFWYKKLYELSFIQTLIKFFRMIFITIIFITLIGIISFIVGLGIAIIIKFLK